MQSFIKRLFLFCGLMVFTFPLLASAAVIRNDANLASTERLSENLYLTGSAPIMAGSVTGDLVAVGGTIVMTGSVTEDGLISGGNINVSGSFGGDVRMFGGNLYFDGTCGGELIMAGGNLIIGPNAVVQGELMAYGGKVNIDPAAKIIGKKDIKSGEDTVEASGGIKKLSGILQAAFLLSHLITIISLLIVSAILFGFMPRVTNMIVSKSIDKKSILKNLGIGLLIFIVMPIAGILSLVSGIGWILGFIILFVYIALIFASMVLSGIVFGGWILWATKKQKKFQLKWWAMIAGVILLHVISVIPLIGWVIAFVFMMISIGALARFKLDILKKL